LLKKNPLLTRAVIFIIMPGFLFYWYAYQTIITKALPPESGSFIVSGIHDEVRILRDDNGVAHLSARFDSDIFFAMGYVHAQDRLWQLELQKRLSQGRLSEIFGKSALDTDIWIRTLEIYEAAKKSKAYLSSEAIDSLQAYTNGINAWLAKNQNHLPIEFVILDVKPEPWKVEDSLAWSKMFALDLGGNLGSELQRFVAAQYLDNEQLTAIFPDFPSDVVQDNKSNNSKNNAISLLTKFEKFKETTKLSSKYAGSNAWVISGKLTESKNAILTNDPHLGLQIPSLWYAVSQKGKKLNASGMSLVGLPVVVFGKNKNIAWGGTNLMADVQDLYIEQPVIGNPGYYRVGEEVLAFETSLSKIKVKPDFPAAFRNQVEPIEIELRKTIHGPIVSDGVPGVEQPVSLRWTALTDRDTTYESFFRIGYAKDWKSFKSALSFHVAPTLNMLYADKQNNIGYIAVGKIPKRNIGNGMLPVSGSSGNNDWVSYIPYEEMPQEYNPESGYIISANNRIIDASYPYFISNDWANPARAQRIEQLINYKTEQDGALNSESMIEILSDEIDLSTKPLLGYLSHLKVQGPRQKKAMSLIKSWDGNVTRNSQAASIYFGWVRHVRQKLFGDEINSAWNKKAHSRILVNLVSTISPEIINKVLTKQSTWCDEITTSLKEDCNEIATSALDSALDELTKIRGSNMNDWALGDLQNTLYTHSPFSQMKLLDSLFERRISNGGSANTINVAGSSFDKSDGYVQTFGAGFRQVISFNAEGAEHLYMNAPGQSGQVGSEHYDDMLEKFRNVEFHKLLTFQQLQQTQKSSSVIKLTPSTSKEVQ
jgi:penicillin G amidase